jgi:hypothetical protein
MQNFTQNTTGTRYLRKCLGLVLCQIDGIQYLVEYLGLVLSHMVGGVLYMRGVQGWYST